MWLGAFFSKVLDYGLCYIALEGVKVGVFMSNSSVSNCYYLD